jgi:two-component system chemotaxis response regulator CheB
MASNPAPVRPEAAMTPSNGPIKVFIVDDSRLVRSIFSRIVDSDPGLKLVGTAYSAEDALAQLGTMHVHVILLDLEMPGIGGMRALPEIIRRSGSAKVMVVSSLTSEGAEHTVQALSLGAADTLLKPQPTGFDEDYRQTLVERIYTLGRRPLRRTEGGDTLAPPVVVRRTVAPVRAQVVAIGASTGGVHATSQLLTMLPARIGVPILVTQHLPTAFSHAYARQLSEVSDREALIAEDGMMLLPDRIYLAPGDGHLCVTKGARGPAIRIDRSPSLTGCMPSLDPMFASLARVYGDAALGVVLTGMGRDGTEGARVLADAGAEILVQNETSSVVWGMPGSVARAGFASAILHPHDIAAKIVVCADRG